jgi:hypothetical protein
MYWIIWLGILLFSMSAMFFLIWIIPTSLLPQVIHGINMFLLGVFHMRCFPLFCRMMLLCVLALFLLEIHYNTIENIYQLIKPKTSL